MWGCAGARHLGLLENTLDLLKGLLTAPIVRQAAAVVLHSSDIVLVCCTSLEGCETAETEIKRLSMV